jgi:hypothetical protein
LKEDLLRRKTKKELRLTAQHAAYALQMLIQDGKVAAADVQRALRRREVMIRDLRERLEALEASAAPVARRLVANGRRQVRAAAPRARKAITRAQRIARQAQGRYLAAVRRLSKDARLKVREIRQKSGVEAAIRAAKRMA